MSCQYIQQVQLYQYIAKFLKFRLSSSLYYICITLSCPPPYSKMFVGDHCSFAYSSSCAEHKEVNQLFSGIHKPQLNAKVGRSLRVKYR